MHHPGWSLNQYLPFFEDGSHATGMTVYLGGDGTNGIVIHGQKLDHGVGLREGLSMYMPFNHGERIVRLSLLSSRYKHQNGPFLLVSVAEARHDSATRYERMDDADWKYHMLG
jgi:hypothetical protein